MDVSDTDSDSNDEDIYIKRKARARAPAQVPTPTQTANALFRCRRCNFSTDVSTMFKKHLFSARTCEPTVEDVPIQDLMYAHFPNDVRVNPYVCSCGKRFHSKLQVARHKLRKREGDSDDLWMPNDIGSENLSYITKQDVDALIADSFMCIQRLVKLIYFHPDHRENHSVRTHKKNKSIEIVINGKWTTVNKNIIDAYIIQRVLGNLLIMGERTPSTPEGCMTAMTKLRCFNYKAAYDTIEAESLIIHTMPPART